MYRTLICICITLLPAIANTQAQTPTYQYTAYNTASGSGFFGAGQEFRTQSLHNRFNFPGMPAGRVKAIYFRAANAYSINNSCHYSQFVTRIGYTPDSTYTASGNDTFRTGLITVYGPDSFAIPCNGTAGMWIRIPVTKGRFYYDPERYFAVEFGAGPKGTATGNFPDIANSNVAGGRKVMYVLDRNQTTNTVIIRDGRDLGLDLGNPTDVAGLSNISAFGLFPNPAAGRRFQVSLEASQPMKEVTVTVSNAVGRVVLRQGYAQPGSRFFKEINVGGAAPGNYFVEVMADGERVVRRVVVE